METVTATKGMGVAAEGGVLTRGRVYQEEAYATAPGEDVAQFERDRGISDPEQHFCRDEEYETTMYDFFQTGKMYWARNSLSLILFLFDLCTGVALAVQCYKDYHTNYSMTYVMITLSTLMYSSWCSVSPRFSYYRRTEKNPEFVFTAEDLKSHKSYDEERDDHVYYCTTSRDVRLKFRLDNTLRPIQGLVFAGTIKSFLFACIQMIYFMVYHRTKPPREVHQFGNLLSIYYWAFAASVLNFSWALFLCADFRYFMELGGVYHFFWADVSRLSLILFGLYFGMDELDGEFKAVWVGWSLALLALAIAMESVIYKMIPYVGRHSHENLFLKYLCAWYLLGAGYVAVVYFGTFPPSFAWTALGCASMTSMWSRLMTTFTSEGLRSLKNVDENWQPLDDENRKHDAFMYGWLLSSETGKRYPRGMHTDEDVRCKVIAFNCANADVCADCAHLRKFFYKRAEEGSLHSVSILDLYRNYNNILKERPSWVLAWAHLASGGETPLPKKSGPLISFVLIMLVFAFSLSRVVAMVLPLTLFRWHKSWRAEMHASSIAFYTFTLSGALPYFYHWRSAVIVWHALSRDHIPEGARITLAEIQKILATVTYEREGEDRYFNDETGEMNRISAMHRWPDKGSQHSEVLGVYSGGSIQRQLSSASRARGSMAISKHVHDALHKKGSLARREDLGLEIQMSQNIFDSIDFDALTAEKGPEDAELRRRKRDDSESEEREPVPHADAFVVKRLRTRD